ncbi:MAG TPA: methylmalonyl-CoA epimerase [Anaerolineaceae bacterium]|jgi:methylmalonyl-CoA/ethylmalonyl-CoA epimerase|nr:methylmalonyl-CoA epimerase [Anaerolineaceae bacterium]HOA20930.1 methylmalonyl-CoA epimerase [Anaerolineaceae bacterium]HOG76701.1 methylmalonyl-CoA epimerase [Anaerolineaceae bacterium]
MKPIKINHVAIVVRDIDESLDFWVKAFGLHLDHVEDVPSQASKVAFLPLGESEVELVQPTTADSGMAAYLEKRGEGMHHLCIEVEDIDAALAHLKEMDIRLINAVPEVLPGRKMAFIHPKAANGVLIELYQLTEDV